MAETSTAYLVIDKVTKMFGAFTALKEVSFTVEQGEFICFLGPSGCGKTTLLRAIAGLDFQTSGKIIQAGRDISNLPPAARDFGIVFQSYALFPNLTVRRNVGYGLENAGLKRADIHSRVDYLLELVGLPDQADKYPAQLSGGQQQRVALARAIATSPGLLLLDEPLSALDARVRVRLRHEVKSLQERLKVTTIMVTHDQEEALSMADRIVVMNDGVIEQIGTPDQIYRHPTSLFVADFIGEMNRLEAVVESRSAVRTGAIRLKCAVDGLARNKAVVVAIRPEDIVVEARAAKKADNAIAVTVSELEFLGSFWRAWLRSEKLPGNGIKADISINAGERLKLAEGARLHARLPAERVHVFDEEAGEA